MIGTFYSHLKNFDKISEIILKEYPESKIDISESNNYQLIKAELNKNGKVSIIKVYYQEKVGDLELNNSTCQLSNNLKGLLGYVSSIRTNNEHIKSQFLEDIKKVTSEIVLYQVNFSIEEIKKFAKTIAEEFKAFIFLKSKSKLSNHKLDHFLDANFTLILDTSGKSNLTRDLDSKTPAKREINKEIYQDVVQIERKNKNNSKIASLGIPTNDNLPSLFQDKNSRLRNRKEIAERICILGLSNYVAKNTIVNLQAIKYIDQYSLWQFATPEERDFLKNPTDENKKAQTIKSESIWVLLWILGVVKDLGFPDEYCDLTEIPYENYPVGGSKDPYIFINNAKSTRNITDVLDAFDFYYRLEWATNENINNDRKVKEYIPEVVQERLYALSWVLIFKDLSWEEVRKQ